MGLTLEEAYHILGVTKSSSDAEIKTAYRRMALSTHPDKVITVFYIMICVQFVDLN